MNTLLQGSGNHIVDLHELNDKKIICSVCDGEYEIDADLREFKEWLENKFSGYDNIFKDALSFYREWKISGKIPCSRCSY